MKNMVKNHFTLGTLCVLLTNAPIQTMEPAGPPPAHNTTVYDMIFSSEMATVLSLAAIYKGRPFLGLTGILGTAAYIAATPEQPEWKKRIARMSLAGSFGLLTFLIAVPTILIRSALSRVGI